MCFVIKLDTIYIYFDMKKFFLCIGKFFKKYLTLVIISLIFLFLFVCDRLPTKAGNAIMDNLKSIATSFTPTTDLFDDGSEVSFVSYFFGMRVNKNEKCDFALPTSSPNISTTDDYMCFNFAGVLGSVADGKVKSVGYTREGEKYLEIEHNDNYLSRYVGRFVLGTTSGEYIKAGCPIATLDGKNSIKIFIYKGSDLVKISEIEWKN